MKYKSVFISDVHLGVKSVKPDILTDFLKNNEFENIFLVGDIIDFWKLKRSWYWPEANSRFIRRILKESKKTNVVYITGNHDEFLRLISGFSLGNIKIEDEYVYDSKSGKILLVHGDLFDSIVKHNVRLAKLGAIGYELLLKINVFSNFIRKNIMRKKNHWSLSAAIKGKVKNAVKYINRFEESMADYAKVKDCSIVIAGHIHSPTIKEVEGVKYINCGDFVESLTIVVETEDGEFQLIDFKEELNPIN